MSESPARFFDEVVAPAIFDRVPQMFPEFVWRPGRDGWVASYGSSTSAPMGVHVRGDRVTAQRSRPGGMLMYGDGACDYGKTSSGGHTWVPWTSWLRKSASVTGREFVDCVVELAEMAGVDPSPIMRDDSGGDPQARRVELERRRAEAAARREQIEADRARQVESDRQRLAELVADARRASKPDIVAGYLLARGVPEDIATGNHPQLLGLDGRFSRVVEVGGRNHRVRGPMVMADVFDFAREPGDRTIGIHRIHLDRADLTKKAASRVWQGQEVPPKRSLGPIAGGSVWLGRGEATDASFDGVVFLTEGIETGFAVRAISGAGVFACISTAGLRAWSPPARLQARLIVVAADQDGNGDTEGAGERAARAAVDRLRGMGWPAGLAVPGLLAGRSR